MSLKITCIKKAGGQHENPYVAITSLTWINEQTDATGTSSREQMYDWIKGGVVAYVKDSQGNKAQLIAQISPSGTKYVKTQADSVTSDNLLKLPECK
jgi:hypothetical protein